MRDITYDPDTDKVTLLDWENGRRWPEFTPQGWDLLIFVHSYLREDNLPISYLYAMMNGYSFGSYGARYGVTCKRNFT